MNDLERIRKIEAILGVELHRVAFDKLESENVFGGQYGGGVRNYSFDDEGHLIGLALDYSKVHLVPTGLFLEFVALKKLRFRGSRLKDVSFLKELKAKTNPANSPQVFGAQGIRRVAKPVSERDRSVARSSPVRRSRMRPS